MWKANRSNCHYILNFLTSAFQTLDIFVSAIRILLTRKQFTGLMEVFFFSNYFIDFIHVLWDKNCIIYVSMGWDSHATEVFFPFIVAVTLVLPFSSLLTPAVRPPPPKSIRPLSMSVSLLFVFLCLPLPSFPPTIPIPFPYGHCPFFISKFLLLFC